MKNRILPPGFPVRRRGSCVPAAYLILCGHPGAEMVQGYVWADHRKISDQHTWIELGGSLIDPTIRQFSWWMAGITVYRSESVRYERIDAMQRFERLYSKPWTDQGHHYRKFSQWIDGHADQLKNQGSPPIRLLTKDLCHES